MKALRGKPSYLCWTCSYFPRLLPPSLIHCPPSCFSPSMPPLLYTVNCSMLPHRSNSVFISHCALSTKNTHIARPTTMQWVTNYSHRQTGLKVNLSHVKLLPQVAFRSLHISPLLYGGSRMIPEGKKVKKPKVKVKEKTVLLIDDDGTNLGEMDGDMAAKLSESKGLKIVLVNRETPQRLAVYKLMSGKKLYEEEKIKKQKSKKDPRQVTKEISVSTKIGIHDLQVKMSHMKEILSKLHNVRVVVELARIPRFSENREEKVQRERERQVELMSEIEAGLEGVGEKVAKENTLRRNKLQCTFKSTVSENNTE